MTEPTRVHVPLGERAYDILIGDNLLEGAGERLTAMFPGRRFGIVTDSEVADGAIAAADAIARRGRGEARDGRRAQWRGDQIDRAAERSASRDCSKRGSSAATSCWRWAAA